MENKGQGESREGGATDCTVGQTGKEVFLKDHPTSSPSSLLPSSVWFSEKLPSPPLPSSLFPQGGSHAPALHVSPQI